MGQITELRVDSPFLRNNYREFLSKPMMIGFTGKFKEKPNSTTETLIVKEKCRGFDVEFKVRACRLTFGKNNEYDVAGIVTDPVSISSKLPGGGFGSYSHEDTGKLMESAIILLAAQMNLMLCEKVCSWPFAKAVVQPMSDIFEQAFDEKV